MFVSSPLRDPFRVTVKKKGASLWLHGIKSTCQCRRPGFDPWVERIPLEEEMATHSSILAWKIPWKEEPGGLQSIGLQKSQTQLSG